MGRALLDKYIDTENPPSTPDRRRSSARRSTPRNAPVDTMSIGQLGPKSLTYLGECEGHISASLGYTSFLYSLGKHGGTTEVSLEGRLVYEGEPRI